MRVLPTLLFSLLFSAPALAAPGYLWEFGMEMEGMPFAMPKQKVCAPKDAKEPPVTREDDECRVLEKKQSGNRFQWKAQCKDGLMEGDITSSPTSYSGKMKMTEKSGETMSMKMSGKRLGECDYQDRTGEVLALQKQSEEMQGKFCQDALEKMQGQFMASCPKEKKVFCQRFATPEGYDKATAHLPPDMLDDPRLGAQTMARECKLDNAKLLPKLCASAVGAGNFGFVGRLCPADRPRLCAKAAEATQLDYVLAHCPTEKAALSRQHCEGRRYSSDIAPRYAQFCAGMAGAPTGSDAPEPQAEKPPAPAEADELKQGIHKLRGLFGF